MIPNIGPMEIAIVLGLALIVFGPRKLPSLGHSLGNGIREFRQGISGSGESTEEETASEATPEPAEIR